MAVTDLWVGRDRQPTRRHGRGLRWRVTAPGYPSSSHRTKAEADAVYAQRLVDGPPKAASTATVGDCLTVWLAGKAGLAPKSREACSTAAKHVRGRWAAVAVADVDRHDVAAWLAGLSLADGSSASASLRRQVQQAMAGALAVALDRGMVERNAGKVSVPASRHRDPHYLTEQQLGALAAASERPGLVWVLGTTGLRISEGCALNVGDAIHRKAGWRLRVRKSKTGRARDVPVADEVVELLDLTRGKGEPLFTGDAGGRLNARWWRAKRLPAVAASVDLGGLHPHDLRHTAASLAIKAGADVKAVQYMLGHASATMTLDLYGHLFDEHLDDVAVRVMALVPLNVRPGSAAIVTPALPQPRD